MVEKSGNCYVENNVAIGFADEFEPELVIPDGVVEIGDRAFSKYYGLVNVHFPESLTKIGYRAFAKCSSLRKVVLPKNVHTLSGDVYVSTFDECKQLIEADLSQTQIKVLSEGVFWHCKKLQTVRLPKTLVKIEASAFWECTSLSSLELNEGLKVIECDFRHNKHLAIFNIPKSVIHIEDLSQCEHIKTIVLTKEQHEAFCEYLPPKCKFLFKE